MQYAIDASGRKVEAEKGIAAVCPSCGAPVVAKCGLINVRHWAHAADADCDGWYEHETEWHREWKALFPPERVEVCIGSHRADIVTPSGLVVELQNSPISPEEIQERERFYGNMVWIVNGEDFQERCLLRKDMGRGFYSFRWKHMRSFWLFADKPVYLDFSTELYELWKIKTLHANGFGCVEVIDYDDFVRELGVIDREMLKRAEEAFK